MGDVLRAANIVVMGLAALASSAGIAASSFVVQPGTKPAAQVCDDSGSCTVITRFSRWTEIIDSATSPDGRFAYVWFRPDRKTLRIALYDVVAGKPITAFLSRRGGGLRWTRASTLLHTSGCGTNCAVLRLYSARGTMLIDELVSGYSVSPDDRYIAVYSTVLGSDEPLRVFDASSGKVLARKRLGEPYVTTDVVWRESAVVLKYVDASEQGHEVEVALR